MFGYLQPKKSELKLKEYELYRSVYCGLCRHSGKDYGIISRLTLSYDCTLLAMLSLSVKGEKSCVTKGHCVCNPLKKCLFCSGNGDSFKFAGAVSVIMTYYKLQDTIEDSGFFKRIIARFLKAIFSHSHKKAANDYPFIEQNVKVMMENQRVAENSDSGVDKAADSTAVLISNICCMLTDDEKQKKILREFGYYVGRWIYLIDAADDLPKDIKKNSFNPFKKHYISDNSDISLTMSYCNNVLNMTVAQVVAAYNLLEIKDYKEIFDNIVYKGLSSQQEYCLFEKYKEKDKSKKDYYPALSRKE
ncbi:MAG: DUF5685 family protein [Clostridia bacterium]|nr:DUF5685 family protein [Clostridia bacterium]